MTKKLLIRDLTLRDGQQSSFATRMNQQQVERVLPFYKDANFYAMEVWGGAVPDSIMRYLGENPWYRLESIKAAVGDASLLTALSRGRNLFGYAPYTDEIIEGFCRNSIESGLGIMRIFDALNDVDNVKSTIKYVKKYGGIADCAVCYTIDPHFSTKERIAALLKGKPLPKKVFTDEYFLEKAQEMAALGADMITIKDMSGLIPPRRVAGLITLLKKHIDVPVDFHTHSTPGYGLASVVAAIASGVDIVDTVIWNFAGGPAAPAIELIYLFCKKMGVELDVNMEVVAKINAELFDIRKELEPFDTVKQFPLPFNPLTDALPAEIEKTFDAAIAAANADNEPALVAACQAIEKHFNFPAPNELVKRAEIPGGMYTNMVAQLKQLKAESILEKSMELIPHVRLDSGLPPLVTPTSQIVGAQAVNCAIDLSKGKPMYTTISNQFIALVKGEYGKTPVPVDPGFRLKIAGVSEETPYDNSKYEMQPNPVLKDCGGVKLAENEKEVLLLELFPMVAKEFLTKVKKERYDAMQVQAAEMPKRKSAEVVQSPRPIWPFNPNVVAAPFPGTIHEFMVHEGDAVNTGKDLFILDALRTENTITAPFNGYIAKVMVAQGEKVLLGEPVIELSRYAPERMATPLTPVG